MRVNAQDNRARCMLDADDKRFRSMPRSRRCACRHTRNAPSRRGRSRPTSSSWALRRRSAQRDELEKCVEHDNGDRILKDHEGNVGRGVISEYRRASRD